MAKPLRLDKKKSTFALQTVIIQGRNSLFLGTFAHLSFKKVCKHLVAKVYNLLVANHVFPVCMDLMVLSTPGATRAVMRGPSLVEVSWSFKLPGSECSSLSGMS